MSGGGAESETAPIQAMMGTAHPGYPKDKGGACSSRGGGGDRGGIIGGRGILEQGRMKGGE